MSMRTATFKALNGDVKISDIAVKGALGIGSDSAQKVEANGSWGSLYIYCTLEGSGWLEDGWYKEDGFTPVDDDDILKQGEGLFVTAAQDFSLTFAGEVVVGKPTVVAPAGMSMIGNPTPVNQIKISEIEVTGALGIGSDSAQKVNPNGSWGSLYIYNTLEGSGWLDDGWYKEDGFTPVDDDDVLAGGEALFVTAAQEMSLIFPAAIAE